MVGSVVIILSPNHSIDYHFNLAHRGWVQLIKGELELNGHQVSAGNGVAIQNEKTLQIKCFKNAELLFFDLS